MINRINNSNPVKVTIGGNLSKARTEDSMTRKELCQKLNKCETPHPDKELTEDVLKMWELGRNAINIEWIPALCHVLRCDVGFIFGEHSERTATISDVRNETGLPEDAITTLREIVQEAPPIKDAIYTFLNDLLDYSEFPTIAIAYEQLKAGTHKDQEYNIMDDNGKFVDFLCGDIDLLILQNRFTRFVLNSSEILSRAVLRREWAAKTDEEKADIIAQIELDLQRGK